MAAQTGRSVFSRFGLFLVDNAAGTLTSIGVSTVNGVGLNYGEKELTATLDAIKGALLETPTCKIDITGPFDTVTHAVLSGIVGLSVPLALDVRLGIRHTWESGEPTFGITGTTTNGFLCSAYSVDWANATYSASFVVCSGSAAPEWATVAHT